MKLPINLAAGSFLLAAAGYLPADTTTLALLTDTYLVMNRDSTPDAQPLLIVEGYHCSACIDQRVLLRFDLGKFAADAMIRKAELLLYSPSQPRPGEANVRVYRMTKNWVGAEANWKNASQAVKWSIAGGDFESTPVASLQYDKRVNVWHTYDVTSLVKGYVENPSSNFGVMLKMDQMMQTVAYMSSDAPQREFRPKLIIDYLPGSAINASRKNPVYRQAGFSVTGSRIELTFADNGIRYAVIGRLDGSVCCSRMINGKNPILSLGTLPSGTYFIEIAGGDERFRHIFSVVRP